MHIVSVADPRRCAIRVLLLEVSEERGSRRLAVMGSHNQYSKHGQVGNTHTANKEHYRPRR